MELKSTQPPNLPTEAKYIAENLRESHPELNQPPQPPRLWEKRLKHVVSPVRFLQNLILANPQDFHGRVYVTPELQDHSNLTARVISVASLFNAITNQPLLFFAFKDFGGTAAILASLTLNLLLIKFTNDNGTAVAGRKYGNQSWAKAGAAAMIAMSVLQSFAAGVGMEAMNNRPYLAELKAREEIERQTENLQTIPATSEALQAAQREFQQLQGEFAGIPRENPNGILSMCNSMELGENAIAIGVRFPWKISLCNNESSAWNARPKRLRRRPSKPGGKNWLSVSNLGMMSYSCNSIYPERLHATLMRTMS